MFLNHKRVRYIVTKALGGCSILVFTFLALGILTARSSAEEWSYMSTSKCKKCHIKQYKSWDQTKMAQAFELLKPGIRAEEKEKAGLDPGVDYTKDTNCLPCHTTGYGKQGGFVSVEETPELVGIGCEVCHGPGEGYLRDGYMTMKNKEFKTAEVVAAGLVIPDASTCIDLCHNEKNPFFNADDPFDWEKRKEEGTHEHTPLKYNHE